METMNPTLPKGRTIPINGDAVRTRRCELCWDVGALAHKAGYSIKTIENIEKGGKRVYAITLFGIANALDVNFAVLVAGPIPSQDDSDPNPQSRRVSGVIVHFTLNFDHVDASDQLISLMKNLADAIGATAEFGVLSVKQGSLVVTLEMSEEDALKLVSAFGDGESTPRRRKLDELGVSRIELAWTPELLRVKEALGELNRSDLEANTYEESHLHSINRKDVWYLWKIAKAQNAMTDAPGHDESAKAFHRLAADASTEGLLPKDDDLFIARLLLSQSPLVLLNMPRVDRGGSLSIFHRAVKTETPREMAAGSIDTERISSMIDLDQIEHDQQQATKGGKVTRSFPFIDAIRRFLKRLKG